MRLRNPNALAYPAGATPGFDPTHPFSAGMSPKLGLSAIAIGSNFYDMLSGRFCTVTGSPTANIDNTNGPCVHVTGTQQLTLGSNSTVAANGITLAAIVKFDSVAAFQSIVSNNNGGSGAMLVCTAAGVAGLWNAGAQNSSTISLSAGVPYFMVCSIISSSVANMVVVNLLSGQTSALTLSSTSTATQSAGTYAIGTYAGASPALATISAVMINPTSRPMSAMLRAAADPWSFWFPRKKFNYVGVAAAAAVARQRMLMGVGA